MSFLNNIINKNSKEKEELKSILKIFIALDMADGNLDFTEVEELSISMGVFEEYLNLNLNDKEIHDMLYYVGKEYAEDLTKYEISDYFRMLTKNINPDLNFRAQILVFALRNIMADKIIRDPELKLITELTKSLNLVPQFVIALLKNFEKENKYQDMARVLIDHYENLKY